MSLNQDWMLFEKMYIAQVEIMGLMQKLFCEILWTNTKEVKINYQNYPFWTLNV